MANRGSAFMRLVRIVHLHMGGSQAAAFGKLMHVVSGSGVKGLESCVFSIFEQNGLAKRAKITSLGGFSFAFTSWLTQKAGGQAPQRVIQTP